MKNCIVCSRVLCGRQKLYCSSNCQRKEEKFKYLNRNPAILPELSTGIKGGIGEILVTVDLLKRGYYVFRSMTQCAPCDIIAYKQNTCISIEVTTSTYTASGINYPIKDRAKFDVLAVINHDGTIYYEPEL